MTAMARKFSGGRPPVSRVMAGSVAIAMETAGNCAIRRKSE